MVTPASWPEGNILLSQVTAREAEFLGPHLERVDLPRGTVLAEVERPDRNVFFIEQGVASVLVTSQSGTEVEAGLIGLEGVTPIAPVLHAPGASDTVVMQVAGRAQRLPLPILTKALDECPPFRRLLTRYAHALQLQTRQTVLSGVCQTIETRLARWLLMTSDRLGDGELPLTHDFMAIMLCVRRPSVTDALHVLEGEGLIRAKRGSVLVLDRAGLEARAGESYGRAEASYRDLIGVELRAVAASRLANRTDVSARARASPPPTPAE